VVNNNQEITSYQCIKEAQRSNGSLILRDRIGELRRCSIVVNKGIFFWGLKVCRLWVRRKNAIDKTLRMTIQIVELRGKRKMQHWQCIIGWIWHITIDV
jgi:hypothetical protein